MGRDQGVQLPRGSVPPTPGTAGRPWPSHDAVKLGTWSLCGYTLCQLEKSQFNMTMHTVWVRLNAVVFFGLTVLLGLSCLAAVSKIGHSLYYQPSKAFYVVVVVAMVC